MKNYTYTVKLWKYVSIIIVAYIIGICLGFGWRASISTANANPAPMEINSLNDPCYKRMYVNGRYYIVFWNNHGLSAVREN